MCAFDGQKKNQDPIEQREQEERPQNSADDEGESAVMRLIDKKRSRQCPGDAATRDESGNRDRDFLKEDGEERADDSAAERDQQHHPLRRLLHEIGGNLEPDREPERRNKEPEKFSSEQQDRDTDDDADDRNGEVHKCVSSSRAAQTARDLAVAFSGTKQKLAADMT